MPSFKDVDFDTEIIRWWPLGKRRSVVLDPQGAFGAPIASGSGIPTAALALAAKRHGSARQAARWYPPAIEREVEDAIALERRLGDPQAPRQLAA